MHKEISRIKGLKLIFCLLVLALFNAPLLFAQEDEFDVLFYEGFENGGKMPQGWTEQQIVGTYSWSFKKGGGFQSGTPDLTSPSAAYAGNYNAFFHVGQPGSFSRRLISPTIDLRNTIKPTIKFWHAQFPWGGGQDELKVIYRATSTSGWVELAHFPYAETEWRKREIILPDEAKTSTCQIAFVGITNWGFGVVVDEVFIEERGFLPRTVESVQARQQNVIFPSGSQHNPFGYVKAVVVGNVNDIPINSIALTYTGIDINDVAGISLYHTEDSLFQIKTPIPADVSISGENIQIVAPTFNLQTGDNYLWFVYDISPTANHGNVVDFTINANAINFGGQTFPSELQNPASFGVIHESLFVDDFEGDSHWSINSSFENPLWEVGIPLGGGTDDPHYAYSGENVLATGLNGDYYPDIPSENPETVYLTNGINAKYYKNLNVHFKRWLNVEYSDKSRFLFTNNQNDVWFSVFNNTTDVFDRYWKSMRYDIGSLASRNEYINFMFSMQSDSWFQYGGWNIDNFAITGEFIHSDVGVTQLVSPTQSCGLGNMTVSVMVKNFGGAKVSTPFEVGYSLDGGVTYVKETFVESIDSEEEQLFTFGTQVDLSNPGLKSFTLKTFLATDQDETNDTHTGSLYSFPVEGFPYQTSFEQSNSHWYPSGINSSWQWGVPGGNKINYAPQGTKVWVTGLSRNYNNNELSYLESPCFDFTNAQMPVLSFMYMMYIEEGDDGFFMQYSVDGGSTWQLLTEHEYYALNWYDTENVAALKGPGWSNNRIEYVEVKNLLPNNLFGNPSVKFRFVFASDFGTSFEGVAIDQFKLIELPYDVGISQLNSPVDACEIGANVPLGLRIENFGYRTIPQGTQIPLKFSVDDGSEKTEVFTLTRNLAMGEYEDMVTTNVFNFYYAKVYEIKAFTNLEKDDDKTNDKMNAEVEVYGIPNYSIGPDMGTMSPDTVVLSAGAGFEQYTWYEFVDPNFVVIDGETSSTYQVGANGWGIYGVEVENSRGCTAFASIQINQSDKDVGVTAINNISSACEHPTLISPKVTITSFNTATFDGTEEIPMVLEVNGVVVLSEDFIPADGWGGVAGSTVEFEFAGTLDLSNVGEYTITAYTDMGKDLHRENDSFTDIYYTWGEPETSLLVKENGSYKNLAQGTIVTTSADTLEFSATLGYETYKWEQQLLETGVWTIVGNNPTLVLSSISNHMQSATYRVTVSDEHGCGEDVKSVFVHASDMAISEVIVPSQSESCYDGEKEKLRIRVSNLGYDTYPEGTLVNASVVSALGDQEVTIALSSDLAHGQTVDIEFPQEIIFPVGEHFFNFSITTANDPNEENNSMGYMMEIFPTPTVTINPNVVYKIFGEFEDYTVKPNYTGDIVSYQWDDDLDFPTESEELFIWGVPAKEFYTVVVENEHGCSASASIQFITSDLEISAIASPKNDCELEDDTPVRFTLYNNGNATYPKDTPITVRVYLDGIHWVTETIGLSRNLFSQQSLSIELNQKLNLEGRSSATVKIEVSSAIPEVYQNNNSINKTVNAMGYPSVSLGPDREVHAWEEILDPGYFGSYIWHDGSSQRTLTASESGNYSVTVTDFTGCTGFAEVNLTFVLDDIEISEIHSPISGCELSAEETVAITIRNSGTHTFPPGTVIDLGYSLDGTSHVEQLVLEQNFGQGHEKYIVFVEKVDLSQHKTHELNIWADVPGDMIPGNNEVVYQVDSYPPTNFSLGLPAEMSTRIPVELDAGPGFVSYLWQDGSTAQVFVAEETGTYHVTVVDANGCEGYDEVYIKFLKSDLNISNVASPAQEDCYVRNMPIEITIKNERDDALNKGAELLISCTVGPEDPESFSEVFTLDNILNPDDEVTYKFDKQLRLLDNKTYTITFRVDYSNVEGNTHIHSSKINPVPSVNLGPDTAYVTFPYTLISGVGNVTYEWSTGSDASSIEATESGTYWLTVTNSFGCTASDTIYLTDGTWVIPMENGGTVSVYPNPADDILMIEADNLSDKEYVLELLSPLGQRVYQARLVQPYSNRLTLGVGSYNPGVYLLRLYSEKEQIMVRIVIQR